MAGANEIRAGKAYVEASLKDAGVKAGLAAIEKRIKATGEAVTSMGKKMAAVGGAIAGGLLVAAQQFASYGSEINDASDRTGVAAETLQAFKYAAEQTGAGLADVEVALKKMAKVVVAAGEGSDTAAASLAKLGLSVTQLKGKKPDEQFTIIAEALSHVSDASEQAALAQELFGKSGTNLLPLIKEGAAGLEAYRKHAEKLGIILSSKDVAAADKFGDTLDDLTSQLKAMTVQTGAAVAEALQPFAEGATRILASVINWIKSNRGLVVSVLAVASGIAAAGVALVAFGVSMSAIGSAVGAVATAFGVVASAIGFLISPIGLVSAGLAALAVYFLYTTDVGVKALKWLGDKFNELWDIAKDAFGGIADALAAGDIGLAADILWTALKLAWATGTQELNQKWIEFSAMFVKIAGAAFYGALELWENVKASLKESFHEVTKFLGSLWDGFVGTMTDLWNNAVNVIVKGLNTIKGFWDDTFDADAANKAADAALEADRQARAKIEMENEASRQSELDKNLKTIEKEKAAAIDAINVREQALSQGADATANGDIAALEEKKKELQEQLSALRAKAETKKSLATGGGPGRVGAGPDFDSLSSNFAQKSQPKSQGTFNAAAIQSLAGSAVDERIAKASERTAKNTDKLVDRQLSYG